jgi:rod shape determining protein RodA
MKPFFEKFKYFDIPLLIVSGLLMLVGLAIIYATSRSGDTLPIFYRQTAYVLIGVVMFAVFSWSDYHQLAKANRVVYGILLIFLLYLLIFGDPIRGSARWIDFGVFNLQPAEFAKIVIILGLARWLYLRRGQINSATNIALTFVYAAVPAGLIFAEPDLGSAAIIMAIWFGMLFISQIKKRYLVGVVLLACLLALISWKFVLRDYQKNRVEVFLNPSLDLRDSGYNVRQAVIAVGSGQLAGRGLGRGLQSQLKFLPERQTDFIFASASEEIGFVGCAGLLVLYYLFAWRLILIMRQAKDELGYYIVGGVLFMFFTQAAVNIGINIGLVPVTGIPLPFLSYGGSSLIVMMIGLGITQSVVRQSRILRF